MSNFSLNNAKLFYLFYNESSLTTRLLEKKDYSSHSWSIVIYIPIKIKSFEMYKASLMRIFKTKKEIL